MENIFEYLIPIIVLIVGFLSTAMNKRKKQQEVVEQYPEYEQEDVPTSSDNYFFRDFLGMELAEERQVEEPEKEELIADEIISAPKQENLMQKEVDTVEDAISDSIADHEIGNENDVLADFDLKQAVIYSELLNTKHF
jgi:hypothetical protein